MTEKSIYLISDGDGAAKTNSEKAAKALENTGLGFHRCNREEWQKKRRWQQAQERREAPRV